MDLFTRLLDAGADGSAGWRGCGGRTLLSAAACGKNEEMVRTLVTAGASEDVNVCFGDCRRESALHVAAMQGAHNLSGALLVAGADPQLHDAAGRSPLHMAAEEGHHLVIRVLLLEGADPNRKTSDWMRRTPLCLAAVNGHTCCVSELLLGGADKESANRAALPAGIP